MSLLRYLEYFPTTGERVFIADGAKVIGRANLGDHVNVWYNSVIRADVNEITIGKNTNVQDLCMFHVTEINGLSIGENTSFGHSVVLHGCKIGSGCLIGMGAIILDGAEIGDNCLVAAGSLVSPGKKFPAGSMIKGRPAVAERALTPQEIDKISNHYKAYLGYKEQYLGMMDVPEKKKGIIHELRLLVRLVGRHNLFLLSSSLAYYAVLALAPLLLILLGIASLVGEDIQTQILQQLSLIAPDVRETIGLMLKNLQGQVDIGSISGLVGLAFMLFVASFVFEQLRYSLDVIYGNEDALGPKKFKHMLLQRGWLMIVVIMMCTLFALSLLINPIFNYLLASHFESLGGRYLTQILLNLVILFVLFTGLYYFTPSKKKHFGDCAKTAVLTSGAFLVGNVLTGLYMRKIALDSLYGAAGALLIFLLWAFYSALTIFLSVELFEFLKRRRAFSKVAA